MFSNTLDPTHSCTIGLLELFSFSSLFDFTYILDISLHQIYALTFAASLDQQMFINFVCEQL